MNIELRPVKKFACCRSCDQTIKPGQKAIATRRHAYYGSYKFYCLDCAEMMGTLASREKMEATLTRKAIDILSPI